ncbi:aspartate--tRNA ligase [Neobittarella massiliensis]|uniref:Aspartate--tRNA ligase n=1 Tax=Neobittarella massiliensis (ex Bilen et al. 2018) TaxID=2041842 RepID=A0A8J6IPJ7_9FIRM|nr:aspartate--tRNA ligase [Neobittarella massiliensis]MBC3516672.1 aspartate--tRNA ligase [Neobittarella massiliensis]
METIHGFARTDYCGEVTSAQLGQTVGVCGFVQKQRDLGNLIFIDLRDRTGIVQLAFDDSTDRTIFDKAFTARAEYVLAVRGTVRERESKNPDLKNGDIELYVTELRVLSKAKTPPFEISDKVQVNDELRLRYRYLDLRRSELQQTILLRHRIVKAARDYYDRHRFVEIETPILIKSTPEGARDYLVPSRVNKGKFYALPQSPQMYKQLLMLAGFDRYMQIAKCFRDEDLRADRQPEFTQIDLEMSFVEEDDVMAVNEGFIKYLFKEVLDIDVPTPFARLPYREAMARYGSDKPDTRFGMELCDLSAVLKDSTFQVFSGALATGTVVGINAKGLYSELSRKKIDKLVDFVKTYRAKGLAYSRLAPDGTVASSFEKFLTEKEVADLHAALGAEPGDVLLIVADGDTATAQTALGALRCEVAGQYGLIDESAYNFLWVTEFPLFEYSEEEGRYTAMHHPFTAPFYEDVALIEQDPGRARARAYDMVLNGCELGGGSIRISDPDIQERMFEALGFTPEQAKERFGFLLEAFQYGVPPHGGMAYGLDRLVMLMLHRSSIRDVIAFPKVQNASELMSGCPAQVDKAQLDELAIATVLDEA